MAKALENLADGLAAYSDREAERSLLMSVFSVFDDKVRRSTSGAVLSADGTPLDLQSPAMQAMQKLALDSPAKHAHAIVSMMKPFCTRFSIDEALRSLEALDPAKRRTEGPDEAISDKQIQALKAELMSNCRETRDLGDEIERLQMMVHHSVELAEQRSHAMKSVSMISIDRLLNLLNSIRGFWK